MHTNLSLNPGLSQQQPDCQALQQLQQLCQQQLLAVTSESELISTLQQLWSTLVHQYCWHQSCLNPQVGNGGMQDQHISELQVTNLDLHWNHLVSNSHSCPASGTTNFDRRPELPLGYPGWQGRMTIRLWPAASSGQSVCPSGFWVSGALKLAGVCTGTGGLASSGGYGIGYGWDVKLWASDWPAWTLAHSQRRMWHALSS